MIVQRQIEAKIAASLDPVYLEVINESGMHNVPPGSESHFKLIIVSAAFADQSLVKRHQAVNAVLEEELRDKIHALSMSTLTEEEWAQRDGKTAPSPQCLGGSKADVG